MNSEYLSLFIDESKEHLQSLNESMLVLENNKTDISVVQTIFRSAHTLKGMSGTMGYEDMVSLTHQMENVLDLIRNSQLNVTDHILEVLFNCIDSLEAMLEDIINGGQGKKDVESLVSELKGIVDGDTKEAVSQSNSSLTVELDTFQKSAILREIDLERNVYHMNITLHESCVMKSARAYMVFDIVEQHGDIIQSTPEVKAIEDGQFDRSFSIFVSTVSESSVLQEFILNISEIDSVDITIVTNDSPILQQKEVITASAPAVSHTETKDTPTANKAPSQGGAVQNRTIRVDIDRLDSLMNLFSELLIDRVRLEQLSSEIKRSDLTDTVEHMNRVCSDLQDIVLKLRMVPIDTVFNRFPRMIRDVSKSLNKKVDLIIAGADTELDRTVIEDIGDPLVHLLRNAVDHGLESSPDRIKAGKSETGTVHLRAFHSGNHVFIEIEDDGPGVNTNKVLDIALKRGIITHDVANKLSPDEINQLLFSPGFSTADKISDISGRGVGLDVVKTKIESLGGHVVIESTPGQGTKFSIQLPLTLSIITSLLVKLGEEKYAIPLTSVVETAAITPSQIQYVNGLKYLKFRNSVIPLLSMSQLLKVDTYSEEDEHETEIVVFRKGEKMAAMMIDEFIGQQDIVLKSMGSYLSNIFAISGATILGDGQVALILDTNSLIK